MIVIQRADIESVAESRSEDYGDGDQLKTLYMGNLYIDEISDDVTIVIKFRPDQYPAWTTWQTLNFCASVSQCDLPTPGEFTCEIWKPKAKSYFAAAIKLPQPSEECNTIGNQPIRLGNEFQFRLEITGSCRVRMFKTFCKVMDEPTEGECQSTVECVVFDDCGTEFFTYDICDALETQEVCNTEQTAACSDGSNPQTVAAGEFCETVTAPTADRVAAAQARVDALALAQAESLVGDCAWDGIVWTPGAVDIQGPHTNVAISSTYDGSDFQVNAFSPGDSPGGGSLGIQLVGKVASFDYKVGTVTNHRFSGTFTNSQTGSGSGVFVSSVVIKTGEDFGSLSAIAITQISHGLGTFPFSADFTNPGTLPRVYQIEITTTVYAELGVTHTQSIVGSILALD